MTPGIEGKCNLIADASKATLSLRRRRRYALVKREKEREDPRAHFASIRRRPARYPRKLRVLIKGPVCRQEIVSSTSKRIRDRYPMAPFVGGLARGFPHGREGGGPSPPSLTRERKTRAAQPIHGEILTSFNRNIIDTLAKPWNSPLQPFPQRWNETARNVEKQSSVTSRINPVFIFPRGIKLLIANYMGV